MSARFHTGWLKKFKIVLVTVVHGSSLCLSFCAFVIFCSSI